MFRTALLLLVLAIQPAPSWLIHDHADLVEINHFYNAENENRLVFDQIIWWDLIDGEYRVVAWRILKNVRENRVPPARPIGPARFVGGHATPQYDRSLGMWVSTWFDEKQNDLFRRVTALTYRETWTPYDPELVDREFLECSKRRGLSRP